MKVDGYILIHTVFNDSEVINNSADNTTDTSLPFRKIYTRESGFPCLDLKPRDRKREKKRGGQKMRETRLFRNFKSVRRRER